MNKFRKENSFLVLLGVCIVILLVICGIIFDFSLRGTWAYFPGGTTGTLGGTIYKVIYSSNWPDDEIEDEKVEDQKKNVYMIMDNMFLVPDGYEFVEWVDSSGNKYNPSDVLKLTADLELYAVWNLIDVGIRYGDVNQNGAIDEEDYLIIEDYVSGIDNMDENAKLNADVNIDGKIDLVDADIVKQVYLGNNLYMGKLPIEPILIYDIYEGNIDLGNGSTGSDTDGGNGSSGENGSSSEGITENNGGGGTGQAGTGTGSSGNNSQGNTSTGSGNATTGGNTNGGNSNNNSTHEENNDDDEEDVEKEKIYYYNRFMNGNLEHMTTRCEVVDNEDSCDLVLPDDPMKEAHIFSGWSVDKNCSNGSIINKSVKVSGDNTYYACFILENDIDNKNNMYVIVMVIGICLIAGRMIWYLVKYYREENVSEVN